jgi:Tfp pilus assembly protein PilF
MDVKFCGQCGDPVQPTNRFCSACGASLLAVSEGTEAVRDNRTLRLRAACELLSRGEPAAALGILDALCGEDPSFALARAYRGIAFLRLVRVPDARAELEEAVRLAPESFICRSKYAEFLARLGFYDQAAQQLDLALALPIPDLESKHAAIELRQFSHDKAKGIYYRRTARPRLSALVPRFFSGRKALHAQEEI